jgi:ABC-type multidrug transport system ATPase subunit
MIDPNSQHALPDLIRLSQSRVLVGRGSGVDVRLPHASVSRLHAELQADGGRIRVRDLQSRSGVIVNGVVVAEALLGEDDVVSFGPVAYEVKGGQLRRVTHTEGAKIEAHDVTFRRRTRIVLSNVALTIPPSRFVGILGPSGSGKTTLLKGLAGYLPAHTGKIIIDGLDLSEHREICRSLIGFVPQEEVLYAPLTARENLDFALRLRVSGDLSPAERSAWIDHVLKRLGLSDEDAARPVATLSGGQRKRVSVAVELLTRPRALFLDEPTAGLDPAAEARLMQWLRDQSRRGTTVICTTHVLESLSLFDAVVVVERGRLRGSGSGDPAKLLAHFKAATFAELYEKLEAPAPPAAPRPAAPRSAPSPARPAAPTHARTGILSQSLAQLQRGALLIARDPMLVALLVGQPLLIALLITLSQWEPGARQLNPLYTFAVVASLWLGLNNTAREIVHDRALYARERRAVINPESYLIAKVALFAAIGLAQVVLLVLWIRYLNFIDPSGTKENYELMLEMPLVKLTLVLWVTYLTAMMLGLLISTLAPTEEVAVAILPLVVLPQLLLSAVATNMFDMQGGWFNALDVLVSQAASGRFPRRFSGWCLELASLLTYSRPALTILLDFKEESPLGWFWGGVVKWAHLLFMMLATATAFVALFLRRERRWLERA